MNRKIRQLEDDVISVLNGSDCPIEAKRLVVANILNIIEKEADKAILSEIRDTQTIYDEGLLKENENAEST
jgi:hypothetical protein